MTHKDAYPLPHIDDTLQTLSGSKWFSTIDLLSGYWQVDIAENDREKTAFITHDGLFEFNVMPFGLCTASATFQRLMNLALSGMLWSKCLVYLDDIISFGCTFEEYLSHLASVLARLREVNLKAKLQNATSSITKSFTWDMSSTPRELLQIPAKQNESQIGQPP